ncbi:hypothetical protein SAMN05518856_109162 [Paenibacillus sp. OK003]|nr:hypothetical protein SAMN05518856_109162 [Paenibacillus sp. OK003]
MIKISRIIQKELVTVDLELLTTTGAILSNDASTSTFVGWDVASSQFEATTSGENRIMGILTPPSG